MNLKESYPQRSLSIELLFDVLFVKCKDDTSTNSLQNSPWFFVRFLVSMFSVKFQIDCSKLFLWLEFSVYQKWIVRHLHATRP